MSLTTSAGIDNLMVMVGANIAFSARLGFHRRLGISQQVFALWAVLWGGWRAFWHVFDSAQLDAGCGLLSGGFGSAGQGHGTYHGLCAPSHPTTGTPRAVATTIAAQTSSTAATTITATIAAVAIAATMKNRRAYLTQSSQMPWPR